MAHCTITYLCTTVVIAHHFFTSVFSYCSKTLKHHQKYKKQLLLFRQYSANAGVKFQWDTDKPVSSHITPRDQAAVPVFPVALHSFFFPGLNMIQPAKWGSTEFNRSTFSSAKWGSIFIFRSQVLLCNWPKKAGIGRWLPCALRGVGLHQ